MRIQRLIEGASPAFRDRLLSVKPGEDDPAGGDEKTDDAADDLSDDLGKDDKTQDDKADDKKSEEQALLDKYDEDLEHEEETYKQRFADTKADRDRLAVNFRKVVAENDKLRKAAGNQPSLENEADEEKLVQQLTDELWEDVSSIVETDPNKKTKEVYGKIAKRMVRGQKQAVEVAVKRIQEQQDKQAQDTQGQQARHEAAVKTAKIVLQEEGLDPVKHLPLFQREVDRQMEKDPDWFKAIPSELQFVKLVGRVKTRLEKITKDNEERRGEAGSSLSSGLRSRRTAKPGEGKGGEGEPDLDTMSGAMLLHTRNLRKQSGKLYQLTR